MNGRLRLRAACVMCLRKREEMQLEMERRRLAELTIRKEVVMQRLVVESLQNAAEMLVGSRVQSRDDQHPTTSDAQRRRPTVQTWSAKPENNFTHRRSNATDFTARDAHAYLNL